jgi:uncharacterized protein
MDEQWLSMLVCPVCKSSLEYEKTTEELHCHKDKLAFPIEDHIPVMLVHKARSLVNERNKEEN